MSAYPHACFLISASAASQFPPDTGAEAAIVGRSNAGKSSAINAIAGRRALARTSKTPGRTRLLNFFELAPTRRLVDLPGYGYARVPGNERGDWGPLIDALAQRSCFRGLLLVVDARRGLMEADVGLLEWAEGHHRPVHVLLSKADKLTRNEGAKALAAARGQLPSAASAQLFSAQSGAGVEDARRLLARWLAGT
ncbi:MAG: ribosome biogenesis GTP-binding protein YihA/YsxC [Steroidobacterales bacterium]